jgi:RNA 2',3'-cyclic 3'-phosphodiesterase
VRVFVALPLPDAARSAVADAIDTMRSRLPDLKWVGPESLHLTLAFLGDIDDQMVEPVSRAVAKASTGVTPIEAKFHGMTQFPERGPLRVLALMIGDPKATLALFYQRVNEEIETAAKLAGLPPLNGDWFVGKPFIPHVTLARVGRGGRGKDSPWKRESTGLGADLEAPVSFDRCFVYRSELRRDGPVHTALARFEFKEKPCVRLTSS